MLTQETKHAATAAVPACPVISQEVEDIFRQLDEEEQAEAAEEEAADEEAAEEEAAEPAAAGAAPRGGAS